MTHDLSSFSTKRWTLPIFHYLIWAIEAQIGGEKSKSIRGAWWTYFYGSIKPKCMKSTSKTNTYMPRILFDQNYLIKVEIDGSKIEEASHRWGNSLLISMSITSLRFLPKLSSNEGPDFLKNNPLVVDFGGF